MRRSHHFVPKDLRLAGLPRKGETILATAALEELQSIIKQFNAVASRDVAGMEPELLARWRGYGDDIAVILCFISLAFGSSEAVDTLRF